MFWNNFVTLCNKESKTPNAVCAELGFSVATATKWKKGAVPRDTTLQKLAAYFNVTVDYLLTGKEKAPSTEVEEADELNELLQELKTRPEMRMLFSLAKGATKEDVELAVAIIQRMRQSGDGE